MVPDPGIRARARRIRACALARLRPAAGGRAEPTPAVGQRRWPYRRSARRTLVSDLGGQPQATAAVSCSGTSYESPQADDCVAVLRLSGPRGLEVFKQRHNVKSSASICTNYAPCTPHRPSRSRLEPPCRAARAARRDRRKLLRAKGFRPRRPGAARPRRRRRTTVRIPPGQKAQKKYLTTRRPRVQTRPDQGKYHQAGRGPFRPA
jgi:hypothetical protein